MPTWVSLKGNIVNHLAKRARWSLLGAGRGGERAKEQHPRLVGGSGVVSLGKVRVKTCDADDGSCLSLPQLL